MTDIHNHLIYGIDDGARDIEESIELISKMVEVGFNNIIITPHFIEGSEYNADNSVKEKRLNEIKKEIKKRNIPVKLSYGNEIFINNHIDLLLDKGMIQSLNKTKYLLVEFSMHNKLVSVTDILYELKVKGYTPIVAHPERYTYFQDNYGEVDKMREEGILFQGNYASILGFYGRGSQKLLKYMLKKHYIDYLGTDLHRREKTFVLDNFPKIEKKIIKICKSDYYEEIKNNCDLLME